MSNATVQTLHTCIIWPNALVEHFKLHMPTALFDTTEWNG